MLLLALIAFANPLAFAQEPFAPPPPSIEAADETRAEIERLTFEVRQAMSARQWSAAVAAAEALLVIDPGNSTARVQMEQAERQIAQGVPEGIPTPTPSPTPVPTPEATATPQAGADPETLAPTRPIATGGETPMELILAVVGGAVVLLVAVWFFFFARKRPAERRTPTPTVVPVVPRPISPYGKAKVTEPPKDENLIQYGSVGQLNQPGGDVVAPAAAAAAAMAAAAPPTRPMEDPPTVREVPKPVEPTAKMEVPPIQVLPIDEVDTHRDESTPADHDASHPAIAVTEPIKPVGDLGEAPPALPEPKLKELQILKVDLESVEIAPAAPPSAGDAGPEMESLPTIKLSDTPVAAAPTPEPEELPVGADLPVISFDASIPLDLGAPTGGEAALAAIAEASLPSIKMSEEAFHFGGADEVGLNDLPDLRGDLGEPAEALPTLKLTDTPLDELEKMINGGKKEETNVGEGDGVKSIRMVEG